MLKNVRRLRSIGIHSGIPEPLLIKRLWESYAPHLVTYVRTRLAQRRGGIKNFNIWGELRAFNTFTITVNKLIAYQRDSLAFRY